MWTHRLFDWEITSYFTTNMRNIRHKTRALDKPRFIQEKQKNLAYILRNFSGDLRFLFCSNTLIISPECRKCILRVPSFQNFPWGGGAYPWILLEFTTFSASSSFSTYSYNFATYSDSYWKPCSPPCGLLAYRKVKIVCAVNCNFALTEAD